MKNENSRWYLSSEFWGCLAFSVTTVLLVWLYCMATPDQMSAEYDWARMEMEGK